MPRSAPPPGPDAPDALAGSTATTPDVVSRVAIDRWIDEGRYAEAAVALQARGDLEPAQELFERIWDYRSALAVASERGDLQAQLRLVLLAGELTALASLRPQLLAAPLPLRRRLAALMEQQQQHTLAAELHESAGELADALRCCELAGDFLSCARLQTRQGELGAAIGSYERVLAAGRSGAGDPLLTVQAHLGLGGALLQIGRYEDAIRPLQRARATLLASSPPAAESAPVGALDEVEVALIRCFNAVGQPQIAQVILLAYVARHPQEPAAQTIAEFLARHVQTERSPSPLLLGRYELVRLLGSGGMGRVYLATDQQTGRAVALKLLPTHELAANATAARPDAPTELWRRFVKEAQLLRGLHHPNIVQLLEFHEEAAALVMEYLPGGSLAQRPLPLAPAAVRSTVLDVLSALAAAHAAGVLHRDLKPHNLLCSATGEIRLGDFGAAYLQGLGITRTESFIGTLAYMAPEQLGGRPLTFATDLYALAVTAFQLLTGRLPFPGPDFIGQHLHDPMPDPRSFVPALDARWAAVLGRALSKAPADRYASVEEMREAVLALPDAEGDGRGDPARLETGIVLAGPPATVQKVAGSGERARVFVEGASPVLETAYSQVVLGIDVRLGRPVLVERFRVAGPRADALAQQLKWLRALAQLGGPGLQRILRIVPAGQEGASELVVHYEVPVGPHAGPAVRLDAAAAGLLRRTLSRLHAAGVVHGAVAGAVVCEPTSALLLVHGRGPLGWDGDAPPSAQEDQQQLARLVAAT